MTSHAIPGADEARVTLCRHIAAALQSGCSKVRVRVHLVKGQPDHAWFYVHRDNTWHKEAADLTDASAVAVLAEELTTLCARQHTDDCEISRNHAADWFDTDIQFRREWLAHHTQHTGPDLESYVMGQLFRDHHASAKDVRRNIRTPQPHRGT